MTRLSTQLDALPPAKLRPLAAVDFSSRTNAPKFATGLAAALQPLESTKLLPMDKPEEADAQKQHQQLIDNAQKWVAQAFYSPILKQMRNSPFKSELFSGGRGEEAFGTLMDQHLTERMSRGSGKGLASAIVRKLEARRAYGEQTHEQLRSAQSQINRGRAEDATLNGRIDVSASR